MSSSGGYWTYDEGRKDFYHAEWNPLRGNWAYTWASDVRSSANNNVPRYGPIPPRPPATEPQPMEPYGARSGRSAPGSSFPSNTNPSVTGARHVIAGNANYVYSPAPDAGVNSLVRNVSHLGLNDNSSGQRNLAMSSTLIVPTHSSRPPQYGPSHGGSQARRHSSSSSNHPGAASYRTDVAAGKLPARDADPRYLEPVYDESDDDRQFAKAQAASRAEFAHQHQGYGSSLEPQTSSASFSDQRTSLSADPRSRRLDPGYTVRKPPKDFFVVGKVFYTLFTQSAGNSTDHHSADFTQVKYGEMAHSQIRRLVVVKSVPKEHFSFCLPITTYQGRGATKNGVDQRSHTIVYSGLEPPPRLEGENKMTKSALRVELISPSEKLDEKSRMNLRKAYPIEWNVKVKEIGQLDSSSSRKMVEYWKTLAV